MRRLGSILFDFNEIALAFSFVCSWQCFVVFLVGPGRVLVGSTELHF
jgi:hypothetical protein